MRVSEPSESEQLSGSFYGTWEGLEVMRRLMLVHPDLDETAPLATFTDRGRAVECMVPQRGNTSFEGNGPIPGLANSGVCIAFWQDWGSNSSSSSRVTTDSDQKGRKMEE